MEKDDEFDVIVDGEVSDRTIEDQFNLIQMLEVLGRLSINQCNVTQQKFTNFETKMDAQSIL
mgnify:FL=1